MPAQMQASLILPQVSCHGTLFFSIYCMHTPIALPNYIEPYVSYNPGMQSIQVQALNDMLASNGTTGVVMVS